MATSRHFGAAAFIQNGMDFQRTYHFEVSFTWKFTKDSSGEPILPTFAAQSVSLPKVTCQGQEFGRGNSVIKFPGPINYDDLNISFVDLFDESGSSISEYFYDWFKNTIYNFDADNSGQYDTNKPFMREISPTSDSIHKIIINEFFPDGEIAKTWLIEGVWISNLDFGQLDYTANDKKIVNVTFAYSRISLTAHPRPQVGDTKGGFQSGGDMGQFAPQPSASEIVASASSGGLFQNIAPSFNSIQDIFSKQISQVFAKPLSQITGKLSDVYNSVMSGISGSSGMLSGGGGNIANLLGGGNNPITAAVTKVQGTVNQILGGFGGGKFGFQDLGKNIGV